MKSSPQFDLPQNLTIDINIEADGWTQDHCAIIRNAVAAAFLVECEDVVDDVELSFLLTDDAAQQKLNAQFRQKDKSTNVLSFPQIEPFEMPMGLMGDISFAYETMVKEAKELDIALSDHLSHLAIHGFLHILGYDHISDQEAEEMESLEVEILQKLNVANPYQDDRSITDTDS